ncbi:FMN-binding protein [bacterium]|nr:FMN-binding protein [bacterium]
MVLICGISAAALSLARQSLGPLIEKQSDFYVRGPALERLFDKPASELLDNKINLTVADHTYPIFYLKRDNQISGLAIEAPGAGGYSGDIMIMIGMDLKTNKISGLEIIQHSETPGVGSKVENPGYRKQWRNLSFNEPVALTSQGGGIDAISGATYSSKAVLNGTNHIIELIANHRDEILSMIDADRK